ncbi:MAG TPA: dTDP-4-dehydrorhamnose 3,5-epimerase [Bacteroidetes bacterium]|nr:dTDP-4-dehydrorhamnose 3,5-epimerase [Bacteroidota bacterium]
MAFKKLETHIEGLVILEPAVFGDHRGFFKETYNQKAFEDLGLNLSFLQDNVSYSTKGILRGIHFQAPPFAQGKLVTVLQGEVLDVAVDLRKNSATYGEHYSIRLSGENHKMFFVPAGFAHGFAVLSATCLFSYKCTNVYDHQSEGGLMWNDPTLGIDWGVANPIISEKDKIYPAFKQFESPFI